MRAATAPHGLTRKEAEKRVREQIATVRMPELDAGLSVADVGARYLLHLEHVMQRKQTTVQDYRIILERHLAPFFGSLPVARIGRIHLERYMTGKRASGLAVKTVTNHLNFAHELFAFALKRGWVAGNPVALVDRPLAPPSDRHFARSAYQHDDDLVFCHPDSGRPYDASKMRVRFKQALQRPASASSASTTCSTPTAL